MFEPYTPPPGASPFARWLVSERMKRRLTRIEMAETMGLPKHALISLENGTRDPSRERLEFFGEYFGGIPEDVERWYSSRVMKPRIRAPKTEAVRTPLIGWLKTARAARGISQTELAAALGFGPRGIRCLEDGRKLPSQDKLKIIGEYLGGVPADVQAWFDEESRKARFRGQRSKDEDLSPFGRIIRNLRESYSMSQAELAEAIGRGRNNYIQRLELGSRRIPEKTVQALADLFTGGIVPQTWRDALIESEQNWHHRTENELEELSPFGQALRKNREANFESRKAMAESLGWPVSRIVDFENGRRGVSDEMLEEMSAAFGFKSVPAEWYVLRRDSGQELQDNAGGINSSLSPFGRLLRRERLAMGISITALSRHIGMSDTYIHEVEYGRSTITPERIIAVARYMNKTLVPSEWLQALDETDQWMHYSGLLRDELPEDGWEARVRRLEKGLSIRELAEEEGIKDWHIHERERGKRLTWKQKKAAGLVKA